MDRCRTTTTRARRRCSSPSPCTTRPAWPPPPSPRTRRARAAGLEGVRPAQDPVGDVPGRGAFLHCLDLAPDHRSVLNALNLVALALLLHAVAVAFHLVTLPVEFNASRRALAQLRGSGSWAPASRRANKFLRAAALTYVAGALAALSLLLYYALIFFGNRN